MSQNAVPLQPAPAWALWANPIAQRCRRARLRPHHLLTYGILGFSVITFVFLLFYLGSLRRFDATPEIAAKATLLPLLVMQGIALMGLGTAALASGIARERDRELLDYQRMTPMSPTATSFGLPPGLPAREYLLFALTLPFIAFALYQAEVPFWKVGKYYAVFFSSVWVYHLTGLCAGVVSKKPWQASAISLGSVVGLYLVLPNLSYAGLAFFDFLTVRPTFFNVIVEELNQHDRPWRANQWIQQYGDVPFFTAAINPTVFSLAIQGFALASLFTVIHRKWVDPNRHPFSKPQGVVFLLGVVVILVGTLWPTLGDVSTMSQLRQRLTAQSGPQVLGWLLGLYILIAGGATLFVSHLITPRQHTARQGFRRALRLSKPDVPATWDSAPSLRWLLVLVALLITGYALLVGVSVGNPMLFDREQAPPWFWLASPMLVLVPACVFVHALSERYSVRAMMLVLFGLWAIPVMAAIIFAASMPRQSEVDVEVAATWIASPSPIIPGVLGLVTLTQETGIKDSPWADAIDQPLRSHVPWVVALHASVYTLLALWLQVRRRTWAKRWRQRERAAFEAAEDPAPPNPVDQPVPGNAEPGNASDDASTLAIGNAQ